MDKDSYMALVRRLPSDDINKLFRTDGNLLNVYLEVLRNHGILTIDGLIVGTSNDDAYKGFHDSVKS